MSVKVLVGDCREVLAGMEPDSFSACVTDPPYMLNFMSKAWDRASAPSIDSGLGHWLAGFADGEGCFTCRSVGRGFVCEFAIQIRADDAKILRQIHSATGIGDVIGPTPRADGSAPMVTWIVRRQADCVRLIQIFRAFPLRAKKARDFEIWASSVDEWIKHEPRSSWADVAAHAEMLSAVKRYGSSFSPEQLFHYRWAKQVFRVLKPGAYLVAFSGTRTYHRMVCAIEDAGFVIHPMLGWITAQGFPKATNLSKQLDKAAGAERKVVGANTSRFRVDLEQRRVVYGSLGEINENGYRTSVITESITNHAKQWEGWAYGLQSLKPAIEPICLAQKPFVETTSEQLRAATGWDHWHSESRDGEIKVVTAMALHAGVRSYRARFDREGQELSREDLGLYAEFTIDSGTANVLRWGTGALNIDACRVETANNLNGGAYSGSGLHRDDGWGMQRTGGAGKFKQPSGRWPANVATDGSPEVLEAFARFGVAGASGQVSKQNAHESNSRGRFNGSQQDFPFYGDTGTAARFFFCGKASKDDRMETSHPTTKPTELIKWLCKLVNPPGGTILDPFAGSGTLAVASVRLGMDAVLIEQDQESVAMINQRLRALTDETPLFPPDVRPAEPDQGQLDLLDGMP